MFGDSKLTFFSRALHQILNCNQNFNFCEALEKKLIWGGCVFTLRVYILVDILLSSWFKLLYCHLVFKSKQLCFFIFLWGSTGLFKLLIGDGSVSKAWKIYSVILTRVSCLFMCVFCSMFQSREPLVWMRLQERRGNFIELHSLCCVVIVFAFLLLGVFFPAIGDWLNGCIWTFVYLCPT